MAIVIRCDRCGMVRNCENEETIKLFIIDGPNQWTYEDGKTKSKKYDLCKECTKQFERDFMRMKPDSTQEDDAP